MTKPRGPQKAQRKRATDKRPVTKTIRFYLDHEVVEAHNEAVRKEAEARSVVDALARSDNAEANARALERWHEAVDALDAAEAEMAEYSFDVKVRAIPRERYLQMLADPKHKPTQEQIDAAFEALDNAGQLAAMTEDQRKAFTLQFNPDTYPRALVEACVEGLDAEELDAIFDPNGAWAQDDVTALFHAAEEVCNKASWLRR